MSATAVPLFPDARLVFALGVFDVIAEVPTGLVVLHVAFTVQLLAPDGIVHAVEDSVSVPLGAGAVAHRSMLAARVYGSGPDPRHPYGSTGIPLEVETSKCKCAPTPPSPRK